MLHELTGKDSRPLHQPSIPWNARNFGAMDIRLQLQGRCSKHQLTERIISNKDKQNYSGIGVLLSDGVADCLTSHNQ